ncbi:conserved hypothetical protein [uncultured Desulfobacterium sp.]|uniref:Uncharacterized protein n=1 Tax=uncultured Desulfobacterium sp. TaxID=201089 RepID=A0A445N0C5_9BACT|nr:conserved hypothetical protein [uncultured Desulfobacterium sp.]
MGTSSSFGGPKDTSRLLPAWAQGNGSEENPSNGREQPNENGSDSEQSDTNNQKPDVQQPQFPTWQTAKNMMSRYSGGGGGRGGLAKAGKAYVGAKGGAGRASQSVRSGKTTVRNLANFLSTASRSGLAQALNNFGLSNLVGKDVDTVFSGLIDAIAEEGADFDKNIARQAMDDALEGFYKECSENQSLDALDSLTAEQIKDAIENFVAGYIYKRWLQELGACVERKSVSEIDAVKLEQEVKLYVKDTVSLELDNKDPLTIDWNGNEGQHLIDSLYEEAYNFIAEGEI